MGTADTDGRLVRAIGRGDLTAAVVNGVIGSAVFGLPSSQAALTGAWSPPSASIADGGRLDLLAHFAPRREVRQKIQPTAISNGSRGRAPGPGEGGLARGQAEDGAPDHAVHHRGRQVPAADGADEAAVGVRGPHREPSSYASRAPPAFRGWHNEPSCLLGCRRSCSPC